MQTYILAVGVCAGIAIAACVLHRLLLRMEARGWIYYVNKQPSSNPMSCLIELQKALEPTTKHVCHVQHQKPKKTQEDLGTAGSPVGASAGE